MKHVLIVNHNAGTIFHGPNFRSYYVARSLVERGFKVTIACASFSHKLENLPVVEDRYSEEEIHGVRMIWLRTPRYRSSAGRLWNYLCFSRRLPLLDRVVREPLDSIVCSSPPPFWIWFCRRLARKRGARLVFEMRDLWPDVILETRRGARFNPAVWLMMIAERVAYRCSDRVVAVNAEARETVERRGLAAGKFRCIPNGVVLDGSEEWQEPSPNAKAAWPGDGKFTVGYAGTLSRVYGLEYLIEAARILAGEDIRFVLAGEGGEGERLRKEAMGLPNVVFPGWIPKCQLSGFLRSVDVAYAGLLNIRSFVIGSDSTKVFEYMKAARPVIQAIAGDHSVVKKSGAGLQVAPEDPSAIASAVLRLRDMSEAARARLGRAGLAFLRFRRSYDVLAEKWVELLDS